MSNRVRLIPPNHPPLLHTESAEEFKLLRSKFWAAIKPHDQIEQMYCEDFVRLVWDIQRYVRWKVATLNLAFHDALYEILVDKLGELDRGQKTVAYLDRWFADESVRQQISDRLAKYRLGESVIGAVAFRQCRTELMEIEQLLAAYELRRTKLLQCIGMYRESLAQQLRDTAIEVAESETRPLIELKKRSSAR